MQLNDECLEKWKVSSRWITTVGLVDEKDWGLGWNMGLKNYFNLEFKIIGRKRVYYSANEREKETSKILSKTLLGINRFSWLLSSHLCFTVTKSWEKNRGKVEKEKKIESFEWENEKRRNKIFEIESGQESEEEARTKASKPWLH